MYVLYPSTSITSIANSTTSSAIIRAAATQPAGPAASNGAVLEPNAASLAPILTLERATVAPTRALPLATARLAIPLEAALGFTRE